MTRWAVPFHLLDACLYTVGGGVPNGWDGNSTAMGVLTRAGGGGGGSSERCCSGRRT